MHTEPNFIPTDVVTGYIDSIHQGQTLNEALSDLILYIEEKSERPLYASILLLDESGKKLSRGAAPSVPESYSSAVDGVAVGPKVGSCGTAVYCGHPIYVVDIETDELWNDYRALALAHGLKACWSIPIVGSTGKILGTFATYYKVARSANDAERRLISECATTAAQLIESFRR